MLKELFQQQRAQLNYFFDKIDVEKAEAFVEACLKCTGLIVFTGVGKSGLVAEKIAMTLISTGTKALFLPPTNFLHGDIGILTPNDLLISISKSGETEELLNLIPFIKKRGVPLLSMTSNAESRLAKASQLAMVLPMEKELCTFDLAPTTSTAIQMLFGDVLAMALMSAKQFSLDEYALNHPSGTIGKKMTLLVKDLMLSGDNLPLCKPTDRLVDILSELTNKKCGCILITDQSRQLLGIFSDGDLRRGLQAEGPSVLEKPISSLMGRSPISIAPDLLAWEAKKYMQKDPKRWVYMFPVVDNQQVVGIIRLHDIIHAGLGEPLLNKFLGIGRLGIRLIEGVHDVAGTLISNYCAAFFLGLRRNHFGTLHQGQ
jgi:arabinose-5-phosphate isomerase